MPFLRVRPLYACLGWAILLEGFLLLLLFYLGSTSNCDGIGCIGLIFFLLPGILLVWPLGDLLPSGIAWEYAVFGLSILINVALFTFLFLAGWKANLWLRKNPEKVSGWYQIHRRTILSAASAVLLVSVLFGTNWYMAEMDIAFADFQCRERGLGVYPAGRSGPFSIYHYCHDLSSAYQYRGGLELCNIDCGVRNGKCSYDREYAKRCSSCIDACQASHRNQSRVQQDWKANVAYQQCIAPCY